MSINREATIRWKGYDPDDLKPKSNKRVWANCDNCGHGRWVSKDSYCSLYTSCALKIRVFTDAHRMALSLAGKGKIVSLVTRKKISLALKGKIVSPATRKKLSLAHKSRKNKPHSLLGRSNISKAIKNSELAKAAQKRQIGGYDIIEHHSIYDHNDLSKYTMKMTRSQHAALHNQMRGLNVKVPHINTGHETSDELKLMEYIKKIELYPNLYKV